MKRNTAELKERLIQTGIKEIEDHGIDQLSLRTVAKSCGITHGTPYRHFESKENYLKVVLKRLSVFLNQFAKAYPYFFEALFIKFPFKYIKVTQDTISLDSDLPGFAAFKRIVLELRKDEGFTNSEAEILFHFWSFISGLAVLANSPIGRDLDNKAIQTNIEHMLDVYIKGERS